MYKKNTFVGGKNIVSSENVYWSGINSRCLFGGAAQKARVAYIGCIVSDNFKDFQYFAKWCQSQVGFDKRDKRGIRWAIDKDLLQKGNKQYHEDLCVFLPPEINGFLVKRDRGRGDYPVGVCFHQKTQKYMAQCCQGKTTTYLSLHDTIEGAFRAYKVAKEYLAKELANKWQNSIDQRAYQALMNYNVEFGD